jgi:hypothetical protein
LRLVVGAAGDCFGGAEVVLVMDELAGVEVEDETGAVLGPPLEKTPVAASTAIKSATAMAAATSTRRSIVESVGRVDGLSTSWSQSSAALSVRTPSSALLSPAAASPNQSSGSGP